MAGPGASRGIICGVKGWISALLFLLVVLAVCTARAQEPAPSLADVARQSHVEKKADSKYTMTDQGPLPGRAPDDSVCGEPIPIMQQVYVAALMGQTPPPDDELGTALLNWLDAHPNLETMDPEQLAEAEDPRTDQQVQSDQAFADQIAQSLADQMVEFRKSHTDSEVQNRLAKVISAPLPQREGDVLDSAVRDEKQRRQAAAGKAASADDRLQEAVNLYAICENKRLIATQGELEKMTRAALRTKLTEAGFAITEGDQAQATTPQP